MGRTIRTVVSRAPTDLIADLLGCAALIVLAVVALHLPALV
jgi:hypothetical protein